MSHTFSKLYAHFVFTPRRRAPVLRDELLETVWEEIREICQRHQLTPIAVGGVEDHLHALMGLPPAMSPAKAAQLIKGASTHSLRKILQREDFRWRQGYSVHSVSEELLEQKKQYIFNQRKHHGSREYPW